MKKIFFSVLLVFAVIIAKSQQTVGTQEQIKRFFNTTTYVVLENNPMLQYNRIIKETVEKHWTLTDFEFVTFSSEEFEEIRKDSTKSFLMVNTLYFSRDKTKAKYDYLCVELGGDYEFVRQMPDIASVPIAYDGIEEEYFAYKLGMLCRFLQNHIELTRDHPELNSKNILKYYYKTMTADVKDKTLYLTKGDLSSEVNSIAKIKAIYPYEVKIVSREEIEAAIDNHEENVVFLHKVGPEGSKRKARCYNTIVGAADAKMYYFSWHMIDDKKQEGLIAKDFKKLAKAKKKK
ncbi:MAG: hypothetical protein JEZ09_13080 [Salinivirgaceae bacterium]|nr:hypothetical protein [Salinivirgaceae bacterium]